MFEPKFLQRWQRPAHYMGETWPSYYSAGVGQSRDSDALERSNFTSMLAALGGESETVIVVRESHWAVGWVEWIAIHESDETALREADRLVEQLEDYPCLDEEAYSELEWNEACEYWDSLSPAERVEMAMRARDKMHWLSGKPVWIYGRMSYDQLGTRYHDELARYLMEYVRES